MTAPELDLKGLDDLPALMRTHELARFLRKTENSLNQDRYLQRGVPFVRVGRSIRYSREAVRQYLERGAVTPADDRD